MVQNAKNKNNITRRRKLKSPKSQDADDDDYDDDIESKKVHYQQQRRLLKSNQRETRAPILLWAVLAFFCATLLLSLPSMLNDTATSYSSDSETLVTKSDRAHNTAGRHSPDKLEQNSNGFGKKNKDSLSKISVDGDDGIITTPEDQLSKSGDIKSNIVKPLKPSSISSTKTQQITNEISKGESIPVDPTIDSSSNAVKTKNEQKQPLLPNKDTNAIVIGVGAGYDLQTYQIFIGSLRATGYDGPIVIGLPTFSNNTTKSSVRSSTAGADPLHQYLTSQGVTILDLTLIDCFTTTGSYGSNGNPLVRKCFESYPDLEIGWASHLLVIRDWLSKQSSSSSSAAATTGLLKTFNSSMPTLMISIPNTIFQRNPFENQEVETTFHNHNENDEGILHFYEESFNLTTENWRVAMPLHKCKNVKWDVPLLSASVILGDYQSISSYITTLTDEYRSSWKNHTTSTNENLALDGQNDNDSDRAYDCGANENAMAIHNYLFYNGNVLAKVHRHRESLVHSILDININSSVEGLGIIDSGTRSFLNADGITSSFIVHSIGISDQEKKEQISGSLRVILREKMNQFIDEGHIKGGSPSISGALDVDTHNLNLALQHAVMEDFSLYDDEYLTKHRSTLKEWVGHHVKEWKKDYYAYEVTVNEEE